MYFTFFVLVLHLFLVFGKPPSVYATQVMPNDEFVKAGQAAVNVTWVHAFAHFLPYRANLHVEWWNTSLP